jgi:hypothetical protein
MTESTLKPDPESMKRHHAECAAAAIRHFMRDTGTNWGDAVSELLCDLMHFCNREDDFDFNRELDRARTYYEVDTSIAITPLLNALKTIASGNTDPHHMVEIAGKALESFCPARGRTKVDASDIPFDDEAAAKSRTAEPEPLQRREIEGMIQAKLIELIRLAATQGIDIETLMHKALASCDPEPP